MGGMAFVAAALGVAACGGPGSSGLAGSSNLAGPRVTGGLSARNGARASALRSRPTTSHVSAPAKAKPSSEQKSPPSPAWLMASAEAAQGWIAATNAFANASYTDDWNSPALEATEASSALSISQSTLRSLSDKGVVARGSPEILSVQVTSVSGSVAQVVGCVGGDQMEVYLAGGRPVPGNAGKAADPRLVSADLVQTANGWKVTKQSTKEGQCSAG